MDHVKAVVIKFIGTLFLLFIVLGLAFNYSFVHIFTLSLLLGVISYILGDLLLLARTSNLLATCSDFALALLLTWFYLANVTNANNFLFLVSFITAAGIALFEAFFHRYLITRVIKDSYQTKRVNHSLQYQAEASEELTSIKKTDKSKGFAKSRDKNNV